MFIIEERERMREQKGCKGKGKTPYLTPISVAMDMTEAALMSARLAKDNE